jgi:excisionase family DNA binding protein
MPRADQSLGDQLLNHVVDQVVARLKPMLESGGNGHLPPPAKRAFRIPEVAELLSLSVREVERLVADGEIYSIRVGRVRLVPSSAIDQFLERRSTDS